MNNVIRTTKHILKMVFVWLPWLILLTIIHVPLGYLIDVLRWVFDKMDDVSYNVILPFVERKK